MGDVVARATEPALAAIKLAWWRERLEELDEGKVPAEPRLQAAAQVLLPKGLRGAELARIEEGWAGLLADEPDISAAIERGARLFALAARLLGARDHAEDAGRLYARAQLLRRGLVDDIRSKLETLRGPTPRQVRPLTALAALAVRDLNRLPNRLEPEGTPGRAWTLLRHRLTGRFPR